MSFKIAMIGAGSIGFTRRLIQDIISVPEFENVHLSLTDINKTNLDMIAKVIKQDLKANNKKVVVSTTTNRKKALEGAKYIFCTIRAGGLEAFETDIEIPLKYGVDQCVGDTLCAGGIMYAQRGIPLLLEFCRDIKEVCVDDALFLNYANPMAMLTWACNKYTDVKTIGLCHGVQASWHQIAAALDLPAKELDITAAGINHQTWFISVKHRGEELTGKLLEAFEKHPEYSSTEKVRIDMLRRFGYYSTESNGHLSEYVPWYRKRQDEIKDWISLDSWILGETGGYLRHCREHRSDFEAEFKKWLEAPSPVYSPENRSLEHGSYIIEALETGRTYRGFFNVVNNGVITNLPPDCIIEAPGYIDGNGINMVRVGNLPMACAATCNVSVQVQRMAMEAAVHGDESLLKLAMLHDPLVGAVCNPPEVWAMAEEMLDAQAQWLPQYKYRQSMNKTTRRKTIKSSKK